MFTNFFSYIRSVIIIYLSLLPLIICEKLPVSQLNSRYIVCRKIACRKMNQDVPYARNTESGCKQKSQRWRQPCKTVRRASRGELVPSTLPGNCARISLNFLRKGSISTEALDFYGRIALSFREEGRDCFYGRGTFLRNGRTFLLEGSSDCFYRRSTRQSRE